MHASAVHRDGANVGLSVISVLGEYAGGTLWHCPTDDGWEDPADIPHDRFVPLDTTGFTVFDGNKAHMVDNFEGLRYSIIFFTSKSVCGTDKKVLDELRDWGAYVQQ